MATAFELSQFEEADRFSSMSSPYKKKKRKIERFGSAVDGNMVRNFRDKLGDKEEEESDEEAK